MTPLTGPRLRVPVVVLLALVLQQTVWGDVRVAGVAADGMLLVAVAAGMVGGPERGALVGFVTGLATDLFLLTPFGLSALVFSVLGYTVGASTTVFVRAAWWIPVLTGFVASVVGELTFAVVGAMVGQGHLVSPRLATIALVVGLLNGALAPLAVRLLHWALPGGPVRAGAA